MKKKKHVVISTTAHKIDDLPQFNRSMDVLGLIHHHYDPVSFYMHARDQLHKALFDENIRWHIQRLMDAGDLSKKANWQECVESFKAVKSARKLTESFGCVLMFVDVNHKQPKAIKRLNDEMGDFKDAAVHDFRRKNAKPVFEALDNMQRLGLPNLTSAPYSSFLEKYKSLLGEVSDLYSPANLSLRHHHRLRVRTRTFFYFYKSVAATTGLSDLFDFAQYLNVVVTEMGKTQDRIHALKLKGEVDEEVDKTCLNPVHRKILGDFLRMHGRKS